MRRIWCNGEWLDSSNIPCLPMDRGVLLGLGLFETILALDGVAIFANRHLARLIESADKLGWDFDFPDFRETVTKLLMINDLSSGRAKIRLTLTAGSGPLDNLTSGDDRVSWMSALPAATAPDALAACLSPWPRNEKSSLAGLKCASYAENLFALDHARRLGFQETIFLNTAGQLCEAATANLFLVTNGRLLTPPLASGCLPGITRDVVIELAGNLEIPCQEIDLLTADLDSAEEIFLTSSIRGITGLSRLDSRMMEAGPTTELLRQALRVRVSAEK